MPDTWEIYVENIGFVFRGTNRFKAQKCYHVYVGKSKSEIGRAGNESVTLFCNGDIVKEFVPIKKEV